MLTTNLSGKPIAMAPQDASSKTDPVVKNWLHENALSTGRADCFLVVKEGQKEIKIPVMKSILAVHSGLVRGLPDSDDVPIIGDHHGAKTVVQYAQLCYPRLDAPIPTFSLTEITKLTKLAHWLDAPKVIDLLFGQLKKVLDNTKLDYRAVSHREYDNRTGGYKHITTDNTPDIDLYPAIFAMADAGRPIKLGDNLLMYSRTGFSRCRKRRARRTASTAFRSSSSSWPSSRSLKTTPPATLL